MSQAAKAERDIFRPTSEPARSIYDAFQREAAKRPGSGSAEWMERERVAVHREAAIQATRLGLRIPSMAEVFEAEQCASGHTDYGAKWAYGVVDAMKQKAPALAEIDKWASRGAK